MKKLFAIAILLLAASTAHVQWTLTGNTVSVQFSTSGSVTLNTTGANLLVAIVGWYNAPYGGPIVSDNMGDVWYAGPRASSPNTSSNVQAFYCLSPSATGTDTITLSTDTSYPYLGVMAFSGSSGGAASPLTLVCSTTGSNTAGTMGGGVVTPAGSGALAVSAAACYQAVPTYSGGSTLTASYTSASAGGGEGMAYGYSVLSTTSTFNPTWATAAAAVNMTFAHVSGGTSTGCTVACSDGTTISSGVLTVTGGSKDIAGSIGGSASAVFAGTNSSSLGYQTQNLGLPTVLNGTVYGIAGGSAGTGGGLVLLFTDGSTLSAGTLQLTGGTSMLTHLYSSPKPLVVKPIPGKPAPRSVPKPVRTDKQQVGLPGQKPELQTQKP